MMVYKISEILPISQLIHVPHLILSLIYDYAIDYTIVNLKSTILYKCSNMKGS